MMGGLTNGYVEQLMYRTSYFPLNFKGVWPCDLFLELIKNNKGNVKQGECFIINLSSSNHRGSHFICIYAASNNKVEYFDSYGLPSIDNNINKAFSIINLEVSTFRKQVQDNSSQFCGLFCSEYLLFLK